MFVRALAVATLLISALVGCTDDTVMPNPASTPSTRASTPITRASTPTTRPLRTLSVADLAVAVPADWRLLSAKACDYVAGDSVVIGRFDSVA